MNIAVIQMRATEDKEKNIQRALALSHRAVARGAAFIALPEAFHYRGRPHRSRGLSGVAENIPGPSSKPFMAFAQKHKAYVLLGSLAEKVPRGMKVFNTSVLIDSRGRIAARYRKINLFDATVGGKKHKESRWLRPGTALKTARIGAFTAGLSICYDIRFPSVYQRYAQRGADIMCVPACFTKATGRAHWEALLRARAIETLSYVIAPNQYGTDRRGVTCYGNSMIVGPWGEVLARARGAREEIIYATLDRASLRAARKRLPAIRRKGRR